MRVAEGGIDGNVQQCLRIGVCVTPGSAVWRAVIVGGTQGAKAGRIDTSYWQSERPRAISLAWLEGGCRTVRRKEDKESIYLESR